MSAGARLWGGQQGVVQGMRWRAAAEAEVILLAEQPIELLRVAFELTDERVQLGNLLFVHSARFSVRVTQKEKEKQRGKN